MPDAHPALPHHAAAERAVREEHGRVLAALIRLCGGDFDAAEEALQDALVAALETWSTGGVPANPAAWILVTARRRALDRFRREGRRGELEAEAARLAEQTRRLPVSVEEVGDDRLRLLFTCCHPALPLEARVALTLRTVAGLTTGEIARAFLVAEPAMAQRLVRATAKIRAAGIPYRVPPAAELAERLDGLLAVIYLVFNEGYAASAGDALIRRDLCAEAIRLARVVSALLPGEPEAGGLLALLLLQDSRREARTDVDGLPVPLEEQDRSLWDRAAIDEGLGLLDTALRSGRPGTYQLQAAIAALHARAQTAASTDWPQICALYDELLRRAPSPVVALNRAVAVAMARGPEAGLRLVDELEARAALPDYNLLHVARADLLRRAGRPGDAAIAYRRAVAGARNGAERAFLQHRLDEVEAAS